MFFSEERVATNKFQNANLSSRIKSSFVVKESGSILFNVGFFLGFFLSQSCKLYQKLLYALNFINKIVYFTLYFF